MKNLDTQLIPGKVGCSCGPDKPHMHQPPQDE